MAEQNILNGNLDTLIKVRSDVVDYAAGVEELHQLNRDKEELEKSISAAKKAIDDEIATRTKTAEEAVVSGYTKSINDEKAHLREAQKAKDKAKEAGVKNRITSETQHLTDNSKELKQQKKELFRQAKVNPLCGSSLYYSLIAPKEIRDHILYLILMCVGFLIIPGALYLLPGVVKNLHIAAWVPLVYDFCLAVITVSLVRFVRSRTFLKNMQVIEQARQIDTQIRKNRKNTRRIKKGIRKDTDEAGYGLEEYDAKMDEINAKIVQIEQEQKNALVEFNQTTRPNLINEITSREQEKLSELNNSLTEKQSAISELEEKTKKQGIFISTNYEVYLGKENLSVENLTKLEEAFGNGATTIAEALATLSQK